MNRCPECTGQGCSHCGGGYFDDPDSDTIWDESMNYEGDDYYEDEWYDDDDYEPDEESYSCTLGKAANGQLYVTEVHGWKYPHQDWGETVDQWDVKHLSLSRLKDEYRKLALKHGRHLKPGDEIPFPFYDDDDDSDDGNSGENNAVPIPF